MNPQPTPPSNRHCASSSVTSASCEGGKQSTHTSNFTPPLLGRGGRGVRTKLNDRLLQDIINYLRLNHNLHSAFLLSKHTHTTAAQLHYPPATTYQNRQFTYTLLIITKSSRQSYEPNQQKVIVSPNEVGVKQPTPNQQKKTTSLRAQRSNPINPAQISDTLYNHTGKQARVYVIPFTKPAVIKKMDFGSNFLTHVLNHTPCLYTQDDTWQQFKNYTPLHHKTVGEAIQKHWDTRYKRAAFLLEIGGPIDADQQPMACFEILNHALTQTCLGLIYVHWEYKPSYTALPYLLHLCSLITPLPNQVFPKDHYPSQFLLHHLCTARTNLIHKTKPKLTLSDIEKAWRKCDVFLDKAQELVKETMTNSPHINQ